MIENATVETSEYALVYQMCVGRTHTHRFEQSLNRENQKWLKNYMTRRGMELDVLFVNSKLKRTVEGRDQLKKDQGPLNPFLGLDPKSKLLSGDGGHRPLSVTQRRFANKKCQENAFGS